MDANKPLTPPAATTTGSPLHFLDYWRIIRIRKTVILAVFLLVVLTTTAVTFVLKEVYRSTAVISVEKDVTDIDRMGRPQSPVQYDPYFLQTEYEKIQARPILYEVISNLHLDTTYARRLNETRLSPEQTYQILRRRNLDVRQSRNTTLIEINAYSEDMDEARDIANAIATVYQKSRGTNRFRQSEGGIEVLSNKLAEITLEVHKLQTNVDNLREKGRIVDTASEGPSFQASLEREKTSGLAQELIKAQTEYEYYRAKWEGLKKLDHQTQRQALLVALPGEQQLARLMTDLAETQQKLAVLRADLSTNHPEMMKYSQLEAKINDQVDDRQKGILAGLENQVMSLRTQYDVAQAGVEDSKKKVAEEARDAREYFQKKRELENKQRLQDALLLRTLSEDIDMRLPTSSSVEIIEPAVRPLSPVRPNIPLNIVLGAIVGLVMGIGLAFFIEYLDTSVKTIDDVERALQSPVLGVIPQNVGNILADGPDSPHAEAYRVLRTNILFSRKDPNTNSVTAVSGGAGEGKSTTIFNLATVFAQSGQRVLIVDSDLRRPSLHKFLGISNGIGLTNYLLKQNTLEEVIQTTKNPNMDFLPSGKLPSSSLGILNSARMKEFVQDVKRRYDFVFFDSPPIMGVSDASILASMVDLSILVVQYRKYPQAMTLRAKQMVEKVGGTMLGVVLNNINISQDSYYYYYSGYYYDYYSKYDYDDSRHHSKDKGKKPPAEPEAKAELNPKY